MVAAGLLAAACGADEPAYTPLDGRVVAVGDSLMVGTQTNLEKLADRHGFDLAVSAVSGRQIPEALPDLEALTPGADVVVIALGTNDANVGVDDAEAAARIEVAVDAVAGDAPVLWVNVHRPAGGPGADAAAAFNAVLDEVAAADPRLEVLDWDAYAATRPELMEADGIHNTVEGYVERSRWLRDALVPYLSTSTAAG